MSLKHPRLEYFYFCFKDGEGYILEWTSKWNYHALNNGVVMKKRFWNKNCYQACKKNFEEYIYVYIAYILQNFLTYIYIYKTKKETIHQLIYPLLNILYLYKLISYTKSNLRGHFFNIN